MAETFKERLGKEQLLPLYTVNDLGSVALAEAVLSENNLSFIEVTYRSDLASQAIQQLADRGKLVVGAGTVRDLDTAKDAIDHGAQFIVSPGLSTEVVNYCLKEDIPVFPGAVTPSEIMQAMDLGLDVVKFFPANVYGGLSAIKSLAGPFFDIQFIPTGGVNSDNFTDYLASDSVLAVGGSFILSEKEVLKDEGKTASEKLAALTKQLH